jgi:hypothetical protein
VFKQSPGGLFYYDTNADSIGTTLINTVENNSSKYSQRDYNRAVLARKIQKIIGRPSTRDFIRVVDNNLFKNCPITSRDIIAAENIFGPDLGSLKVKTVSRAADPVDINFISIPPTILSTYKEVILAGDIMFINEIPMFVTISRHIKFGTSEMFLNRQPEQIFKAIKNVHRTYRQRGFRITTVLLDHEFNVLRGDLADRGISLNSKRTRSVYNTLPFQRFPTRIVVELVAYCVFWLNSFPHQSGVSDTLSPRTILTGMNVDYLNHCRLEFGTYVHTHEC